MAKAGKRLRSTKAGKATKPKSKPAKAKSKTKSKKSRAGSESRSQRSAGTKPTTKRQARSRAKPLTPQQRAAVTRKLNAAKKAAQRASKSERQRQRRTEQREAERLAAAELSKIPDERDEAIGWLEHMTPSGFALDLTEAEIAADTRGPWLVVGKFQPMGHVTYADLWESVRDWRDDLILETTVNPNRISCIRITYEDPNDKRGSSDSVVSQFGTWDLVVSDMTAELDPNKDDSLSVRYANTRVVAVYVYFAAAIAKSPHWYPHYQREAA
jgi:hypothetical protein